MTIIDNPTNIPLYVINDINDLAVRITRKLKNPTPIKVQATCYFCWAFYSGITKQRQNQQLFEPHFIANKYGIICEPVFENARRHEYVNRVPKPLYITNDTNDFLNFVIEQISPLSDRQVMGRSKLDLAYKRAYMPGQDNAPLDPNLIIKQYTKIVDNLHL